MCPERSSKCESMKPFVKWAGGKTQLLDEIRNKYPKGLGKKINRYCEPFVGGGAVLFDVISSHSFNDVLINDINPDLINAYVQIRDNIDSMTSTLSEFRTDYNNLSQIDKETYFYEKRKRFNELRKEREESTDAERASLFIFLNKTCFNGLYRVNRAGEFNVPFGRHKKISIYDEANLFNISKSLQNVNIVCGDYKGCEEFIRENTFVYIDPPYRPLSNTANFTSYAADGFTDKDQIELGEFIKRIDSKGAKIVLSNSDPKNSDKNDNFFDDLYAKFTIDRVNAKRMINSNGNDRGHINEIIVANYSFSISTRQRKIL